MKKIILLLVFQFTALMAITYNVTNDGQMIPVTEDQSPTTVVDSTPTVQTTGSAKTNWGFQPFSIPSASATVAAGGNIQAAIDSLPNGGTVNLAAGTYYCDRLEFKPNMVIQGAGVGQTILKHVSGGAHIAYTKGADYSHNYQNLIIRDLDIDGSNGQSVDGSSIHFTYGCGNLLFENIKLYNVSSGITVTNGSREWRRGNITFRNLEAYNISQHAMEARYVDGLVIENSHFHDIGSGDGGYAMDLTRVLRGEISNVLVEDTGYGTKFPSCNYMYVHDTTFRRTGHSAIKLQEGTDPDGDQYLHLENVIVDDSLKGIYHTSDVIGEYTFEEVVVKNVSVSNISDYTSPSNKVRIKGANYVYEYGDGINMTYASEGKFNHLIQHPTGTPEDDNVGWTSWPALQQ